ncbi:MAG: hypothetical protein II811_08445, partial [Spirochaetaceae bacterium]|nr:hypothetical protein [Spirochaetaceae bacterium]
MLEQYKLPYSYDALEPVLDALTVETHYGKHHAAYTKAFNEAAEKAGLAAKSAEEILSSLDAIGDTALRNALRNNGGGFYNHNLYFSTLAPNGKKEPTGELADKINELTRKVSEMSISDISSSAAESRLDGVLSELNKADIEANSITDILDNVENILNREIQLRVTKIK